MELASILSGSVLPTAQSQFPHSAASPQPQSHHNTMAGMNVRQSGDVKRQTPPALHANMSTTPAHTESSISPVTATSPKPKSVAFELLFSESTKHKARLPMRVQIFPHDTTDSIVTTVKNFYGLYAGSGGAKGVSFEDVQGNTLIARYENLHNNMIVYVRVIDENGQVIESNGNGHNHSSHHLAGTGGLNMAPPHPAQALSYGQHMSRPESRTSRKRSASPGGDRRSVSISANPPPLKKSRSKNKSRNGSTQGSFADYSDGFNGYSSGDGGAGSVSSKSRSEHIGNTEISLDNIVEGGRRKRAKFESSELPLFAPPQMPAATSNSSVSPARRMEQRSSFPFSNPSHNPFSHPQSLHSPQQMHGGYGQSGMYATPANNTRRSRGGNGYPSHGSTSATPGSGVLPTPDPTIRSCMSEEDKDVALQLIRLGDMSNISHGRTSASTLDDTFSGRADATSSTGATSDAESESENELPPLRRQKLDPSPILPPGAVKRFRQHLDDILPSQESTDPSGDEGDFENDGTFHPGGYDNGDYKSKSLLALGAKPRSALPSSKPRPVKPKTIKPKKTTSLPTTTTTTTKILPPGYNPSHNRKTSNASALSNQPPLGDDEQDLSSKPRCQRCRKSKKGCDRQRPCQRCKDAGLSADQCVSEDEGNGRKGRYGRHMGVVVKKDEVVAGEVPLAAAGGFGQPTLLPSGGGISTMVMGGDKSKKRKR